MSWPLAWMLYAVFGPFNVPVGRFTFQPAMAFCTSFNPRCSALSRSGSTWTRTAYFCDPQTLTCATPETMEMRWATTVSAYVSTYHMGSEGLVTASIMMGWSAGLN